MGRKNDRIFFVILFSFLGIAAFALIFVPPFFKEGGLTGQGVLLLISVLSLAFARMIHNG